MHMARVLFYELCKANVIWAQFREPVEDTGLTGVEEGKVLWHLRVKQSGYVWKKQQQQQPQQQHNAFSPLPLD